ncbi:Ycf66 family protein [Leptolyngbya sp. DQ-M1]|uniref:Ycf66 family protein n=1 Tax=Leptolyngbya sp. DQ-M1 TaxID=2933920 RepID=UPI003296F201
MLTYLLALVVALGSFGLYMSAFFYPDIYRKGDLTLAGVGLFYALVLWICADRITGAVLLGQIASVALIGWFGYQALTARLGYTPSTAELQSKLNEVVNSENTSKVLEQGKRAVTTVRERVQSVLNKTPETPAEPYQPLKREDFGNPTPEASKPDVMGTIGAVGSAVASLPGVFGGLFKKPEKNTTTYVRKDFREDATETDDEAFNFEEDIVKSEQAVESKSVSIDQDGASESASTADEIIEEEIAFEANHPQAVPPHPPTPEQVEAALADAEEKNLPADPPEAE